jgi:hypothetical protein
MIRKNTFSPSTNSAKLQEPDRLVKHFFALLPKPQKNQTSASNHPVIQKNPGLLLPSSLPVKGFFNHLQKEQSSKRTKKICRPPFAYRSADTIERPIYKKTLPIVKRFF